MTDKTIAQVVTFFILVLLLIAGVFACRKIKRILTMSSTDFYKKLPLGKKMPIDRRYQTLESVSIMALQIAKAVMAKYPDDIINNDPIRLLVYSLQVCADEQFRDMFRQEEKEVKKNE